MIITRGICFVFVCFLGQAIAGCSHFKENYMAKPKVEVLGAEVESFTDSDAQLLVKLRVTNPNKVAIDIDKLSYQIFLNDGTNAETHSVSNVHIPHNDFKEVKLPLKINYKEMFKALGQLVRNKDVNYRIKGQADVGVLAVPFDKSGKVDLK